MISTSLTATGTVVKVTQDHDLWWFKGESPGSGYNITATLTAQGVTSGTFTWQVTSGADKLDLIKGSTIGDTITVLNDNSITVTSTAASAAAAEVTPDVTIRVTYSGPSGSCSCQINTVVFAPDHQVNWSNADNPNANGYTSYISYYLENQFNDILPYPVPWAEDVDGNGNASSADQVSAAAISDYPGENWAWSNEGSGTVSPSDATDNISGSGGGLIPAIQNPQTPLGTQKVDHSPLGAWYVGSLTIGKGVKVASVTWQRYRDHGRHE